MENPEKIVDLISKDQIEEALDILKNNWPKHFSKKEKRTFTNTRAQYYRITRQLLNNEIDKEFANRELSKIRLILIDLITSEKVDLDAPPLKSFSFKSLFFLSIFILVLSLGIVLFSEIIKLKKLKIGLQKEVYGNSVNSELGDSINLKKEIVDKQSERKLYENKNHKMKI